MCILSGFEPGHATARLAVSRGWSARCAADDWLGGSRGSAPPSYRPTNRRKRNQAVNRSARDYHGFKSPLCGQPHLYDARIPPVVYLSGVLMFVAGLAIVRTHNHWARDWTVLVTLTGWFALALGPVPHVCCGPLSTRLHKHERNSVYGLGGHLARGRARYHVQGLRVSLKSISCAAPNRRKLHATMRLLIAGSSDYRQLKRRRI
jgi:hypothetical protein